MTQLAQFRLFLFLPFFLLFVGNACATTTSTASLRQKKQAIACESLSLEMDQTQTSIGPRGKHKLWLKGKRKKQKAPAMPKENTRFVSVVLTIALGFFGAHRLYLGTNWKVPIVYTLTLGGGLGILPAIDLIMLLFSKDLTKFQGNTKVFMWS